MDKAQHGEEIDVIISDRGIFDALCWFHWLMKQHHMSEEEYKILTQFATLYRWKKNIDLVYVFTVEPFKSIEREYSNLLTNKRGSIMREDVLQQYLVSLKTIQKEYNESFSAVHEIDTTYKQQNDVGYEVTLKTLEVLRDMLIETGQPLVTAVCDYFKWLGFLNVTLMDGSEDVLREDIQIDDGDKLYIIEVKGIGGTSTDAECSQVAKHRRKREKENRPHGRNQSFQ